MTREEQLVQDFVDAFLGRKSPFKSTDDFMRIAEIRGQLDSIDPNWRETLNEPLLNRVRYWTTPSSSKQS